MDDADVKDIIQKVKTAGQGDGKDVDVDINIDDDEIDDVSVDTNEPDGGELGEGINEDVAIAEPNNDDLTIDLINKYNPTLIKIQKLYGNDSDLYRRFSNAMSNNDESFLKKLMKDSGVLFESKKNSKINLYNPKKTITFVDELKYKLKEHHNMNYTDYLNSDNEEYVINSEPVPTETPTKTPTETPTKTPRRDKPFQVPVIKPGTEPRPKATN